MPGSSRLFMIVQRLLALAIVVVGIAYVTHYGLNKLVYMIKETVPVDDQGAVLAAATVALVLIYAVVMALPFVPGVEIGVALLMFRGAEIAPFLYLATVIGLSFAYFAGRRLPDATLSKGFAFLGLENAGRLMTRISSLPQAERLQVLHDQIPGRLALTLLRFRYIAVGLLLNLPGNGVIGGGGGICLIAGLTRLFRTRYIVLTIAIAVAPVPVLVWGFGMKPWL